MTTIGGKVEGKTSDERAKLDAKARAHEAAALCALVDYYAAVSERDRCSADERIRAALKRARAARQQGANLKDLQDEAQAQKSDLAKWLKALFEAR